MVTNWINKKSTDFKNYIHFDPNKKFKDVQDEKIFFEHLFKWENFKKHKFWPFIRNNIIEEKFVLYNEQKFVEEEAIKEYVYDENHIYWKKIKNRPITYPSHLDYQIYSYYSYLLGLKYEEFLNNNFLWENIIAYKKKKKNEFNNNWKNNIDFAKDAFEDVFNYKNVIVFSFDIKSFFDTINHKILKDELIYILWWNNLQDDWYRIYKNITKFAYINLDDIKKYNLITKLWKFQKIIDIKRFNELKSKYNLINVNKDKWIPQWSPISWMLANVYMNKFDLKIKDYLKKINWKYYRYSDDILLIIPYNSDNYIDFITEINNYVKKIINIDLELDINDKKTEINIFLNWQISKNYVYNSIDNNFYEKKITEWSWFQYLWFIFDWKKILIRNKTLSNYYKKMIQNLKRLYHLKDNLDNIKTNKILLWKFNRKYIYNWIDYWFQYKKENSNWVLDKESKSYFLWFLWYWFNSYKIFNNFCKKNNIKNWIKKQLSSHKKIYEKYLYKLWIKK